MQQSIINLKPYCMKKLGLLLAGLLLGATLAQAQTVRVSGTVTGADDGMPLPGVSVIVKGTTTGAATDMDGKYSLNAPENATLVFSYIGYATQEVALAGRTTVDVVMESAAQDAGEVMVVAYGTAKKSAFTGSAGVVKSEALEKRTVSNVSQALTGQVAGVQTTSTSGAPGTSATIRIRGIGSMSASNNPLYVVDGMVYEGNINSINQQDIESMTVLKDAAANALYGARGANGVILITTKKGTKKEGVINVSAKWGNNTRAVPNYDVMTDPAMYYETYFKALYNNRYATRIKAGDTPEAAAKNAMTWANNRIHTENGLGYQIYTLPDGEGLIGTDFKLNPKATLGYSDGEYYYIPDDWYKELFDKGNLRQEYNVSASGSSDKIKYYTSAGMLDDKGIIEGSGFKRFTTRLNASYQAKEWLNIGGNVSYTYSHIQNPSSQTTWGSSSNAFYMANMIAPIYPMYVRNADGSIKKDAMGITVYDFGTTAYSNRKRAFMSMANPAITFKLDQNNVYRDELNSKYFATVTPIEGLDITASVGVMALNNREHYLSNPFYGWARDSKGYVEVEQSRYFAINQQYLATYKKTFDLHNVDFLLGYESNSLKWSVLNANNKYVFDPNVAEINNTIFTPPTVNSYTHRYAQVGILARAQYNFDEKYFASASFRRDASSRFHKDNRWGNFWSIGGAWVLSKESFMEDLDWLDLLKVKMSYGQQGNDNLGSTSAYYYLYQDQYTVTSNDGKPLVSFSQKGNKDITWETSHSFNAGFDFELFAGRLTGGVEYFTRSSTDLLYLLPMPFNSGYTEYPMNVGAMRNSGFEIDLNGTIVKTDNLEWKANLNATHVKNVITDLHESVKEDGIKYNNAIFEVGGSRFGMFFRRYAGVDASTGLASYYVDPDNGDWTTTTTWANAKQSRLGCSLPKIYGGFGSTLEAYGVDLSVQLSYQLGGRVYDGTYEHLMHSGSQAGQNWHMDILNAWTPENTNTDVPRLNYADQGSYQRMSDRFVTSSNYLSLNSVVLGYTFPSKVVSRVKLSSVRVYVAGDNLALLSARKGLDPRQYFGLGGSTASGNFTYSAMRTISGGINITF